MEKEVDKIAIKISASCCAQVSYRTLDTSIEKAIKIYNRLVESKPMHASPFEHQARPIYDMKQNVGNFKGWKQHRHEILDNTCWKFNKNL